MWFMCLGWLVICLFVAYGKVVSFGCGSLEPHSIFLGTALSDTLSMRQGERHIYRTKHSQLLRCCTSIPHVTCLQVIP